MPPIVWFFAGGAAIALLIFSVVTRFAADRIDNVTERLGDSSRLISHGEYIDEGRPVDVILALTDSSFLYEGRSAHFSLARDWIRQVEYEKVRSGKLMRIHCFGRTFEFRLAADVVPQWELLLPSMQPLAV